MPNCIIIELLKARFESGLSGSKALIFPTTSWCWGPRYHWEKDKEGERKREKKKVKKRKEKEKPSLKPDTSKLYIFPVYSSKDLDLKCQTKKERNEYVENMYTINLFRFHFEE